MNLPLDELWRHSDVTVSMATTSNDVLAILLWKPMISCGHLQWCGRHVTNCIFYVYTQPIIRLFDVDVFGDFSSPLNVQPSVAEPTSQGARRSVGGRSVADQSAPPTCGSGRGRAIDWRRRAATSKTTAGRVMNDVFAAAAAAVLLELSNTPIEGDCYSVLLVFT